LIEKQLTNRLTPWHQNPKFGREYFITMQAKSKEEKVEKAISRQESVLP
jgi:hypothetical protein